MQRLRIFQESFAVPIFFRDSRGRSFLIFGAKPMWPLESYSNAIPKIVPLFPKWRTACVTENPHCRVLFFSCLFFFGAHSSKSSKQLKTQHKIIIYTQSKPPGSESTQKQDDSLHRGVAPAPALVHRWKHHNDVVHCACVYDAHDACRPQDLRRHQ